MYSYKKRKATIELFYRITNIIDAIFATHT
ncbi:MAG: hypothetical protein BWY74_03681 [Firmicutes bacterium ADurb.Bin419]|nr:MAG: hypothetical protein BWY74_03681 [Firmicutes bacterium ADurb.Bin419]